MMQRLRIRRGGSLALIAALALTADIEPARAEIHAAPETALATSRAAVPVTVHRVFGTVLAVGTRTLIVQLRSGRQLRIDASRAFALRRVSEPLFRGKPVVVEGVLDSAGAFEAVSVQRTGRVMANWGLDR